MMIDTSDAPGRNLEVPVTGNGVTSLAPVIAVSPASLDFGSVNIGQTKELELTVRNSGSAPLTVSSTSSSNARFTMIVPAPPFTVSPGGAQPVRVRFTPASATAETGTLAIASNDTATPLARVDLRGMGTSSGTGRTPACVAPPANTVSWWPGDGNANDLTGGNNGTLQGGATFAAGNVGQAFQFNGSATYVQIGNPANLRIASAITIEGWVNARSVRAQTAGPPMGAILTKWAQNFGDNPDSDSYGLWLVQRGNSVALFSALHQPGPKEPNIEGGAVPLNTWTHVAMTFDGTSGSYLLYVNGQVVASTTSVGSLYTTNHNVQIGREDSYIGRVFDGLIDEVAVYSRALSASEIQAIAGAGNAGKCRAER